MAKSIKFKKFDDGEFEGETGDFDGNDMVGAAQGGSKYLVMQNSTWWGHRSMEDALMEADSQLLNKRKLHMEDRVAKFLRRALGNLSFGRLFHAVRTSMALLIPS